MKNIKKINQKLKKGPAKDMALFASLLLISLCPLVFAFGWGNPLSFIAPAKELPDMSLIASRIVKLADDKAVFDFCGGMMFQLVLSDKLRADLAAGKIQPVVYDASKSRMKQIPNYSQSSEADDSNVFYGREVRKVPTAAGGMGFVLQLCSATDDPESWSPAEVSEYNGWAHDSGRKWRKAGDHEAEGNSMYKAKFGPNAFGLHHRFYWHLDRSNGLWLSAEDGCEGVIRSW